MTVCDYIYRNTVFESEPNKTGNNTDHSSFDLRLSGKKLSGPDRKLFVPRPDLPKSKVCGVSYRLVWSDDVPRARV